MPAVTRPDTVWDRRAMAARASATSRWIGWTSRCSVRPAGGCRHHGLRLAVEQALAEFPFQLGDLHAERGLDDVHPLRGAGDAALLEQGDEVGDLTEIHTRDPGDTSNAPEDHVRAGRRNSNRLMGGITNRYFSRLREELNASSPGKLGSDDPAVRTA